MFCQQCGNKVNSGAVFCPQCGAKLFKEDAAPVASAAITTSTSIVKLDKSIPQQFLETTTVQPASSLANESVPTTVDKEVLKMIIGKNSDYYLKEFEKIERGETSFNTDVFLLGAFLTIYRRQFFRSKIELFLYISSPIQASFLQSLAENFSGEQTIILCIGGAVLLSNILAIKIGEGRGFNKHYKNQLYKAITEKQIKITDEKAIKKLQPSLPHMILCTGPFLAIVILIAAALLIKL